MQYSSSPGLFAGRSDVFIIDQDDAISPEMHIGKKYLDRLLKFLCQQKTSTDSLIKTIKQVIERWNEQLINYYPTEVDKLENILCHPPEALLIDESKRNAYLHLFAKCLAPRIDLSLTSFHTVLADMKQEQNQVHDAIANFIVSEAKKVATIAIQCFPLLSSPMQSKMKDILLLLQQQPAITFKDTKSNRFKVFSAATDCFSFLDINLSLPALELHARPLPSTYEFDDWENLQGFHSLMFENSLYSDSSIASLSAKKPLSTSVLPHEELGEWEMIMPFESKPLQIESVTHEDSFQASSKYKALTDSEMLAGLNIINTTGMHQTKLSRKLHDFQIIHQFGSSFLIQYGDFIISEVSTAVLEAIKHENHKQRLLDLAITYFVGPIEPMAALFLRQFMAKSLPHLITGISAQAKLALNSPELGAPFCEWVIKKCTPLCFSKPLPAPRENKQFLLNELQGFANFLSDLNASLAAIAKSCPNDPTEIPIHVEEQLLIVEMNRRMHERQLPILIPLHKNLHVIAENIFKATEAMLRKSMHASANFGSNKEQELLLFVLSHALAHMLNRIFSSNGLCILLDLFSQRTYAEPLHDNQKIYIEKAFTNALVPRLKKIALEIFKLSEPSVTAQELFSAAINSSIGSPIEKIAKLTNKLFEKYVCTKELNEVLIMPILLLNHLLFNDTPSQEHVSQMPCKPLLDYLKMSSVDFVEMKQKVEAQLKSKSVQMFTYFINQHLSWAVQLMIRPIADAFTQGLANRLYRLSQQEMMIKMLMGYMLFDERKG